MISSIRYWFLLLLVLLVYVAGMFVNLFEQESSRSAVMAMRMAQKNEFINLFNLSEGHLVASNFYVWLSAISFKFFGINDWSFRIPGIVATLLAAYSCFGLGSLLYNSKVGKLAVLVFLTTQIIVFSNTDVRLETLITGISIFTIWQLVNYIEKDSLTGVILGSIGTGLTFSATGFKGILFIFLPLICHLIYTRKWKALINSKTLVGILVFIVSLVPILYSSYFQTDEAVVQQGNDDGVLTLLWESLSRTSELELFRFDSFDFKFFQNFLWTFLPWTAIGVLAYLNKIKTFFRLRFNHNKNYEFLTLGGVSFIVLAFSFIQDKSVHSLNPMIPVLAILVASYLYNLYRFHKTKHIKTILGFQYFIFGFIFIVSVLLCYYVFKDGDWINYIWKIGLVLLAIFFSLKQEQFYFRLITISVLTSIMINAVLNTHALPEFMKYQAGMTMAKVVAEKEISPENIFKLSELDTWSFDFYNKKEIEQLSINMVLNRKNIWLYANELQLSELNNLGYDWDRQYLVDHYKLNRLNLRFLDPATRKNELERMYLIHIY